MSIPVVMTPKTHKAILKELHSNTEVIALNESAFIAYNLVGYNALMKGDWRPVAKIVKGY
jgi:hypothetical protein